MPLYHITTRDAAGQDVTVKVSADKAEFQGAQLVLTKKNGDLVGSFISVTNFVDTSQVKE